MFLISKKNDKTGILSYMVTSTGFEPVSAAVKGRCVKPLHQLASSALIYYHTATELQGIFFKAVKI